MKFFLGLVEFSSKSLPCHSEGPSLRAHTHAHARTHTHTHHTHTHTPPRFPLNLSSGVLSWGAGKKGQFA